MEMVDMWADHLVLTLINVVMDSLKMLFTYKKNVLKSVR